MRTSILKHFTHTEIITYYKIMHILIRHDNQKSTSTIMTIRNSCCAMNKTAGMKAVTDDWRALDCPVFAPPRRTFSISLHTGLMLSPFECSLLISLPISSAAGDTFVLDIPRRPGVAEHPELPPAGRVYSRQGERSLKTGVGRRARHLSEIHIRVAEPRRSWFAQIGRQSK